jgi:hypothetical protein
LGLGKSLTGLGLKKFKKPWAWACPKIFSTPELFMSSKIDKLQELSNVCYQTCDILLFFNLFFPGVKLPVFGY